MASISKEDFESLRYNFGTVLLSRDDVCEALHFVYELLCAETEAVKEKSPYAYATISSLETATNEVANLYSDIEGENFEN